MNHVDRVRAYLRRRAEDEYAGVGRWPNHDPNLIDHYKAGQSLTVSDLDALVRDAERLHELEDL